MGNEIRRTVLDHGALPTHAPRAGPAPATRPAGPGSQDGLATRGGLAHSPGAPGRPRRPSRASPALTRPPRPALPLRPLVLLWLALAGLAGAVQAQPREVRVGAYVTSISDVDVRDGRFRIVFFAWFNDPTGKFDLERDLYFVARDVEIDEVETEIAPDGNLYTYARIQVVAPHEFDLENFPFDRQKLMLRIEAQDAEALNFVPDAEDTGFSDYIALRGWTIDKVAVSTAEHVYDTGFGYWRTDDTGYSQIVLNVDISRTRSTVLLDDFLGFTFAFLITSLTFFVPCTELGLRIGMTTGSLFAAVVNLNRLHDAVGFRPEFAMVDRLAFLVFGALFGSLAIAIATNRMSKHGDLMEANRLDTRLGIALMSVVLVLILLTIQAALA